MTRRTKKKRLGTCLELNRSISLFFAITRVLGFISFLILILSNKEYFYVYLHISPEQVQLTHYVPYLFRFYVGTLIIIAAIVDCLAVCGFAQLNRYLVAFYGTVLLLEMFMIVCFVTDSYRRQNVNEFRMAAYKNFTYSKVARQLISTIQSRYKCCGIEKYRFEDQPVLPPSCCQNLSFGWLCEKNRAYKERCAHTRESFYQSLFEGNFGRILPYVGGTFFLISMTQVTLSFYMVRSLNKEFFENPFK